MGWGSDGCSSELGVRYGAFGIGGRSYETPPAPPPSGPDGGRASRVEWCLTPFDAGSVFDALADQVYALAGGVGVGALVDEEGGSVLRGLAGGLGGVDAGQGGFGAVLLDELGPLHERGDHLVLGDDGDVLALDEQVAALVAGGDADVGDRKSTRLNSSH